MNEKLIKIASFNPKILSFPNSWVGHLPFAFFLMQELKPKVFVELGTHSGNSYFGFCQSVLENKLETKCYAVDTWLGDEHAGSYGEEFYEKVKNYNEEYYTSFSTLLRMLFDEALERFEDKSIDLLHIDGLHTYEAVKHDYETWLPKMKPDGVIVFHDSQVFERNFGVYKLWNELSQIYPCNLEFKHCNGLGILQLNSSGENQKLDWLASDFKQKDRILDYFKALGDAMLCKYEYARFNSSLKTLEDQVQSLKSQIEKLHHKVGTRDKTIEGLNNLVSEKLGQIQSLEKLVCIRNKR